MAMIFGRPMTDALERIGALHQVIRVDRFVEDDGPARGARRMRLINGGGLEIDVHPDRAMDIGQVTVMGTPVAWISPVGVTSPHFYEPDGTGWLRTFSGGLLTTCGLDSFGPSSEDENRAFGLHGRISTTPASVTAVEASANGVAVTGTVRQSSVFGEHLVLRRRIASAAGSDTIVIDDTVTNEGFAPTPHMVLYHVNLGWPLLDEDSTVEIASTSVRPRDDNAYAGMHDVLGLHGPMADYREQVFHHGFADGSDPTVRVTNPRLGLVFEMSFSGKTLPYLVQWKMLGQGHYVLGLEPTNTDSLGGRAAARAAGVVPLLAAGDDVAYTIRIRLAQGAATPAA